MLKNVERVIKTLNFELPDRVPKGELLIDKEFVRDYLGMQATESLTLEDEIRFLQELDMDFVSIQPKGLIIEGKDPWGREKDSQSKLWQPVFEEGGNIDAYREPKAELFDFEEIRKWSCKTDYFVFAVVSGGFDISASLLGFMEFLKMSKQNPKAIEGLIHKITSANARLAKKAIEAGAHGVIIGDDIAYNKSTFLSPKMLRKILFPYLKKQVDAIKKLGVPVIFHADGNINQVLEDIVEMGFDGVHSLQPSAGMDIASIKEHYGNKLVLMGNMDLDYLIPLGSQEEIEFEVKRTMEVAKQGGGYIFGTCGALSEGLPLENVKTLYSSAKKYGRY